MLRGRHGRPKGGGETQKQHARKTDELGRGTEELEMLKGRQVSRREVVYSGKGS